MQYVQSAIKWTIKKGLWLYTRSGIAHVVILCLQRFEDLLNCLLQWLYCCTFLHAVEGYSFSTSLTISCYLFLFCHSRRCKVVFYCALNYYFFLWLGVEPRALYMLSTYCTHELYHQPLCRILYPQKFP